MNEAEFVSDQPLILDRDFKAFAKVNVHNQYYNEYVSHVPVDVTSQYLHFMNVCKH